MMTYKITELYISTNSKKTHLGRKSYVVYNYTKPNIKFELGKISYFLRSLSIYKYFYAAKRCEIMPYVATLNMYMT